MADSAEDVFHSEIEPFIFPPTIRESENPTLVLLVGQPGAGRSRAVHDVLGELGDQTVVLRGADFAPFAHGRADGPEEIRGWIAAALTTAYSRQTTGANGAGTYSYDAFGRQTALPAADAADPTAGNVTIGYYSTDAARSIAQGGVTTTYALDPDGRRVTTTVTGGSNDGTTTQHYVDDSDNPAWATSGSGASTSTTAYTAALGASLGAQVTTGSGARASLDLANISGDIAATVTLPATGNATGIDNYTSYDEYGNPQNAVPATGVNQYGWNGTQQRATGGAGLTLMGARLYNPGTGRFTSMDAVSGGNENSYNYPNDPINSSDITGQYTYWHRYALKNYPRYSLSAYFKKLRANFGKVFPPIVWGFHPSLTLNGVGQKLWTQLGPCFISMCSGWIEVVQMTSRSFEIKALKGHPEYPGTVTFTIGGTVSNPTLTVYGVFQHGAFWTTPGEYAFLTGGFWYWFAAYLNDYVGGRVVR